MEKNTVAALGATHSPVSSDNEWDLLEEVIVGVVDGASFPPAHIAVEAALPHNQIQTFRENRGKPFPPERIVNILSLDEKRIVVERQDEPMIAALKEWGFVPIPCNFRHFNSFGGSFHCATLDVRRAGKLESYILDGVEL